MIIKELCKENVSVLARLDEEIFPSHAWGEESLYKLSKSSYESGLILFSDEKSEALGYVIFSCMADAEIYRIGIREGSRGQGLGSSLLSKLISYLKEHGSESIFLEVRSTNIPAIALYHAFDFCDIGIRKDYYKDPVCDALLMKRELI